jgi:cell division protein ZapA (FtsZ GTPase activity inhibitor)
MGQQSITVRIAGKSYPMSVSGPDEEENVRKAETLIRERMTMFEQQYAVRDVRDLLSMCVLQFATEALESESQATRAEQEVTRQLKELEVSLDAALV